MRVNRRWRTHASDTACQLQKAARWNGPDLWGRKREAVQTEAGGGHAKKHQHTHTHTPDICRFVRREDKPFGAVWDVFPQERGNNAKMPVEEWGEIGVGGADAVCVGWDTGKRLRKTWFNGIRGSKRFKGSSDRDTLAI